MTDRQHAAQLAHVLAALVNAVEAQIEADDPAACTQFDSGWDAPELTAARYALLKWKRYTQPTEQQLPLKGL